MVSNVFKSKNWGVHIKGPDSVLAAESFQQAAEKCAQINSMVVSFIERGHFDHPYSPITWATVEFWEDIAPGSPHDPENTNWDEVY